MATDELSERMDVLQQAGFVDETGRRDLEAIADILTTECGVERDNEILGTLVTHVAAALRRARDGEAIDPLDPAVVDDVRSSPVYDEARRLQQEILAAMESELSEPEQEFVLVHVGGLLTSRADE